MDPLSRKTFYLQTLTRIMLAVSTFLSFLLCWQEFKKKYIKHSLYLMCKRLVLFKSFYKAQSLIGQHLYIDFKKRE